MVSRWNEGNSNLGKIMCVTIVLLTLYWLALFFAWPYDQISPLKWNLCNFVVCSWVWSGTVLTSDQQSKFVQQQFRVLKLNFIFNVSLLPASCLLGSSTCLSQVPPVSDAVKWSFCLSVGWWKFVCNQICRNTYILCLLFRLGQCLNVVGRVYWVIADNGNGNVGNLV